MRRWETCAAIAEEQVLAIVRAPDRERPARTARALVDGGLRVVEVSLSTPGALDVIAEARGGRTDGLVVGAGTVLDATSARLPIFAGAESLVSPALSGEVQATAHRYGVATLPGVSTPTKVVRALEGGADLVKLFPASEHALGAVRDLLQALPQAPVVPTGGVESADAAAYVAAGAVAVGLGSALAAGEVHEVRGRPEDLRTHLRAARRDPSSAGMAER